MYAVPSRPCEELEILKTRTTRPLKFLSTSLDHSRGNSLIFSFNCIAEEVQVESSSIACIIRRIPYMDKRKGQNRRLKQKLLFESLLLRLLYF